MSTVTGAKRKGRPPHDVSPPKPMPWECKAFAKRVDGILEALEVPQVDIEVRRYFQRTLYLDDLFGFGGREKIILLIRTILESEGNEDALIEPVVRAVSHCMKKEWTDLGLAWIEAFDKINLTELLQTMRSLDLFSEKSLGHYLGISLRNKLWPVLEPLVSKPAQAPAKRVKRAVQPKRGPADKPARRMAA